MKSHLSEPGLVVENLKLQQNLCQPVVVADDEFGLGGGQHPLLLLEDLHGLLDAAVKLTGPQDSARDGGQVTADGGLILLFVINPRDHLNVPPIVLKDLLILLINS